MVWKRVRRPERMGVKIIQANFSFGELDQKLLCRPDFDGYYKGAKKLRNVICIPQGGAKRRFGTKYAFTVVDTGDANAPITNRDEVKTIIFDFSKTKAFLIVVRPHDRTGTAAVAFDVYLDNVLQTTKTTTDYTIAQIKDLNFVRSQNRVIILHPNVAPHELFRGSNDTTWTLSAIQFVNYPVYDFSVVDPGPNYRTPFPGSWSVSATSGNAITITALTPLVPFFDAGHVGGLIIGGGGVARITAVTDGYIATARTIQDFDSTGPFIATETILQSVAWGDFTASVGTIPPGGNRGFPSVGEFFQNRLFLGATPSLPNFLSASNILDYYNFDTSEPTDLNGFTLSVGANGNEEIQDIIGSTALVVLGFSGIYASSLFVNTPITPTTAFLNEQSRDGSTGVESQIVDNQIFYIDENQEQIRTIMYNIQSSSFQVLDASLLSPQLITDPVSTAALRPKTDDGTFYMVVNRDGTLAVFQSLKDQSVNAWTLNETRGSIYQVTTSRATAYMVARRGVTTGLVSTGYADNIYTANSNFQAITNISAAAQDPGVDVSIFSLQGDYLIIGHESPFYNIDFTFADFADVSVAPIFEYLNNLGQWELFSPTDGTFGFTMNGAITWNLEEMTGWYPVNISADSSVHLPPDSTTGIQTKFWIRIQRATETLTTVPVENTIFINVDNRIHLESIDFDELMDCSFLTQSDSDGVVTGLTHLIGQQVYALVNTIPEGPYFVDATGSIIVRNVSTVANSIEVGINFIPEIIPMPLSITDSSGVSLFSEKLIKTIYLYYYNSLGILVNGDEIATLEVGSLVLDQRPIPVTGFKKITPRQGWNPTVENVISQDLPLPFTIIGIGYIVEVS